MRQICIVNLVNKKINKNYLTNGSRAFRFVKNGSHGDKEYIGKNWKASEIGSMVIAAMPTSQVVGKAFDYNSIFTTNVLVTNIWKNTLEAKFLKSKFQCILYL